MLSFLKNLGKHTGRDYQIAMEHVELAEGGDFSPKERTDKLAPGSDAPRRARAYTDGEMAIAKAALSLHQIGDEKGALKLLKKQGLSVDDVSPAVEQYWAEALGDDSDEADELGEREPEDTELTVAAEPAFVPQDVERKIVPVDREYTDSIDDRALLIAVLWRMFGDGWQVESYDEAASTVGIVRGQLPAMRPGAEVHETGTSATAGNAAAVAAAHLVHGRTMLGYDPYRGEVETAILPPVTMELRDRLLRKSPRQKSWELELLPIFGVRDGVGYLAKVIVTRADQVSPDRDKEIAYWLGLAKNTIGHSGWWVSVDDARGVIEMTAGTPISIPSRVGYDFDVIENGEWGELVVGRDGYNKPVIVDLSATPHALVVGRTGSGKSIFLQSVIFSALAHGFELAILDPTKRGLDFRWARPYVRDGGWGCQTFPEALAALEGVYKEARRRLDILDELSVPKWSALTKEDQLKYGISPILVVIDEGTSMSKLLNLPKTMDKEDPEYIEMAELNAAKERILMFVGKILRECRFVGIHLVFGTQRFGVGEIGQGAGEMRENMGARIVLGRSSTTSLAMACADPQDAAAAYEQAHGLAASEADPSATEREATPGRGLAEIDGRGHIALQGAYAPVDELTARLAAMGIPAHSGDRRPVIPEKESPFGVVESAPSYSRPVPAAPKVVELAPLELSLEDFEEADDTSTVEAPQVPELDGDAFLTTAAPEAPEPDWRAFAVPAADQDDELFTAAPLSKPRPSLVDDDDPFAAPRAKPRLSVLDDDPFGDPVPAKPKNKVEQFDW